MSVYDLNGRKALVTGGARGLGAGMAQALARAGAAVVIADVLEDLGQQDRGLARGEPGPRPDLSALDVTDDDELGRRPSPTTIAELGGLDILVNNAGVEISVARRRRRLRPMSARCSRSTSSGPLLGLKHAFRAMRPGGAGWQRRGGGQHLLGRGHHRLPRHRRLLGHQVRRRPTHPGRRDGVRQARVRRAGELRLPRAGADRDGHASSPPTWPPRALCPASRPRSATSSG